MKARFNNLKIKRSSAGLAGYSLAIRFTGMLLVTALLTPIVFFNGRQSVSASSPSPISNPIAGANQPAPVSVPPEPFVFPSSDSADPLIIGTISSIALIKQSIADGRHYVNDGLGTPDLPEGFANAKVPTVWERISELVSVDFITAPVAAAPAPGVGKFDFDGDGKADPARWLASSGEWKYKSSSNGAIATGTTATSSTTMIAPADYDGDGKTDYAVLNYSNGTWTIKNSYGGAIQTVTGLGQYGDKVVSGRYDADGLADEAVYRPSTGTWYVRQSSTGTIVSTAFGLSTDIPTPGDYNNDGLMDYSVYRPSTGTWYVMYSSTGSIMSFQWGISTDTPAPADYDGDGKTDFAVYRPSTGTWYINNSGGAAYTQKTWGNYGDQPVPADYDGDGKDDMAIWRPNTGLWYIVKSTDATLNTYDYQTLGMAGDVPAEAAYVKQIGAPVQPYGLAKARLSPKNATGGTNLYSRNFSWGTGLVNLPGRAGLDAGFGISYNSLVWTKQFGTMIFDADYSNVSPGFRFGFPTIEPVYYDSQTGKFAYLMVTPSGGRVEFRQNAATGVYETADSSYAQLNANVPKTGPNAGSVEFTTITVTAIGGTQMTYTWKAGAFRCSEIKDRNGNFITINHDDYGLLRTVTDTLGRVISVNYDSQQYPISITQDWKTNNGDSTGTTFQHPYATFTYANSPAIDTHFAEVATPTQPIPVYGPPNGTVLKVLTKITMADLSYTTFDYNTYGQMSKITNFSADNTKLNSVSTDLDILGTAVQPDCPRFSLTRTFVKDFNGGVETLVHNSFDENQQFNVGGMYGSATKVETYMDTNVAPHNVKSRTWYYPGGNWQEGLPFATEDFGDNAVKRWTTTAWTQDDPSSYYILNPRVTESRVGDSSNVKRTTIDYLLQSGSTTASLYGLPSETKLYDGVQGTLLKTVTTSYNISQEYLDRRIIGLPNESDLYDGIGTLMAKTTYTYDGGSLNDSTLEQNISPVQHDNTNYSSSFIIGRGNLTSTTRYEVPNNATSSASTIKYNTAGSPVSQIDPMGREVKIGYIDSFNDTPANRNTYAYPTKLTTAGSDTSGDISSYIIYRYDIGANVRAESPNPAGTERMGKITERIYDDKGRIERQTLINNGAYTRYEYPTNQTQSKVYSTITTGMGEALSETFTDGEGRVLKSRMPLKFDTGGNTTAWSMTKVVYDILGQVTQQSVPTEVDSSDALAGDDAARGTWLWTRQKYDWKGRVVRKINTDGADSATLNDSDVLVSYEGCGCAGGQVTTVQGELMPRDDQPNTTARRTQKIYEDVLGRTWKVEEMKWDGVTPYKTTVTALNGRDQATSVTETDSVNSVSQITTMTYDGFGRLQSEHRPEQTAGTNTTYEYNADDRVRWLTDARGAKTTYGYNSRGLLNSISYSAPTGSGITLPASISFDYDALGNRKYMMDGLGRVDYEYNQFSQMTAETRQFNDALANAPITGNKFRLEYTYGISGQLTSYKDPYGKQINYTQDKVGRLNSVTGTSFGDLTTYANNPQYRAWGALKSISYGDGTQMQMAYDNRLQVDTFQLTNSTQSVMKKNYDYYADGSLKYVQDELDARFDRLNIYDYAERIKEGKSGGEARGLTVQSPSTSLPYRQSYTSDAFGNMTQRMNMHWGKTSYPGMSAFNLTYTYLNNRVTNTGWEHDADGRVTKTAAPDTPAQSVFSAAGQLIALHQSGKSTNIYLDGDGREGKREQGSCTVVTAGQPCQAWDASTLETRYFIRSSVLDKEVISEADFTGKKSKTFVLAAGATLARQEVYDGYNGAVEEMVYFQHEDASGMSQRTIYSNGAVFEDEDTEDSPVESDPLGGNMGLTNPYLRPPMGGGHSNGTPKSEPRVRDFGEANFVNPMNPTVKIDGKEVSQQVFQSVMRTVSEFDLLRLAAHHQVGTRETGKHWGKDVTLTRDMNGKITSQRWGEQGAGHEHYLNSEPIYGRFLFINLPDTLPRGRFALVGFFTGDGDIIKRIEEVIDFAINSEECTKAFKAINAKPIKDQLADTSVVTQNMFDDSKNDSIWADGTSVGEYFRGQMTGHSYAYDVSAGNYEKKGHNYIGLTDTALGPPSGDREYFSVVVIHSLIHTGGISGQQSEGESNGLSQNTPHDLKFLGQKYKDILKACTKEGSSKLLYGQ